MQLTTTTRTVLNYTLQQGVLRYKNRIVIGTDTPLRTKPVSAACGCHLTFREGVGGYPSSRLVVYRGKPLAAASSSSRSFLEVLIGAGASESWSLVEDPGGRSDREASSFLLIRRCRHLFLLLFLCRFFWA